MMSTLHMLATLALVGALSGGGLALVFRWAEPLILENERRETLAAVNSVVPGGTGSTPLAELLPGADGPLLEAFRVEDAAGAPLGWALVGTGTGFQDKIRLMVGLSADLSETRGLKVLKDNETPGLGTKIRDGDFPAQFAVPGAGPRELGGGLRSVKGPAGSRREVSAVTGATISSVAVVEIINASVAGLRPRLEAAGLLEPSSGEDR